MFVKNCWKKILAYFILAYTFFVHFTSAYTFLANLNNSKILIFPYHSNKFSRKTYLKINVRKFSRFLFMLLLGTFRTEIKQYETYI